jgi:hypothetical protein
VSVSPELTRGTPDGIPSINAPRPPPVADKVPMLYVGRAPGVAAEDHSGTRRVGAGRCGIIATISPSAAVLAAAAYQSSC